jgi:hypothetical protein
MLNALRVICDCHRRTGALSASWSLEQKKLLSCAHFVIIIVYYQSDRVASFCELVSRAEMVNALCVVCDCRLRTGAFSASWFLEQKKILSCARSIMMICLFVFILLGQARPEQVDVPIRSIDLW